LKPLRAEWELVQAEVRQIIAAAKSDDDRKAMVEARKPVYAFYDRLCDVRVLDPACGSGNFLFVALDVFKRLENEILDLLHDLGATEIFNLHGRPVTVEQFLGIEIKPWAKEITELVLWIGWLQWQIRTRGWATNVPEPVLRDYHNIERRDAVLAYDAVEPLLDDEGKPVTRWDCETTKRHPVTGEEVPDDAARIEVLKYLNPRRAEWPKADFVVGNPPFIGNKRMRNALGDGYVEALRRAHDDVPESADYVMYWWNQAAHLVRRGEIRRFGFITTNSITQVFNRKVLQQHVDAMDPLSIVFAIPDHPWVDSEDGAAVRVAMTAGVSGAVEGDVVHVVDEREIDDDSFDVMMRFDRGRVHPDLSIGAATTRVQSLRANEGISFMGVILVGQGFVIEVGDQLLLTESAALKPYVVGNELNQHLKHRHVIDFFGLSSEDARARYPNSFQRVLDRVKPERDANRDGTFRSQWWLHGRPRAEMRAAVASLERFVAICRTAKHFVFQFLPANVLVESKAVAIALDDAWAIGVLSSRPHVSWALSVGSRLEDRPTYNNTLCFDPFPFPLPNEEQKQRIRELGEQLDAHRKRRQQLAPGLTITGMYNVMEKLRRGEELTAKEKVIHEDGLVSVLKQIHDDLDAAVFDAYGWPRDLSDDSILERLVALNHERAEEERRGIVRWLRPEFQARAQQPAATQESIAGMETTPSIKTAAKEERLEWPSRFAERITAVRDTFFVSSDSFDTDAVMRRFKRARRRDIEEVLESLEALGLLVSYEDGTLRQWKPVRRGDASLS
jgi:hypothetical protein